MRCLRRQNIALHITNAQRYKHEESRDIVSRLHDDSHLISHVVSIYLCSWDYFSRNNNCTHPWKQKSYFSNAKLSFPMLSMFIITINTDLFDMMAKIKINVMTGNIFCVLRYELDLSNLEISYRKWDVIFCLLLHETIHNLKERPRQNKSFNWLQQYFWLWNFAKYILSLSYKFTTKTKITTSLCLQFG